MTITPASNPPPKEESVGQFLTKQGRRFIREIVPPVRYVAANVIVSSLFLLGSEVVFWIIDLTAGGLRQRVEFIGWFLDGAQVISFVATIAIFIVNTMKDFLLQVNIVMGEENLREKQ